MAMTEERVSKPLLCRWRRYGEGNLKEPVLFVSNVLLSRVRKKPRRKKPRLMSAHRPSGVEPLFWRPSLPGVGDTLLKQERERRTGTPYLFVWSTNASLCSEGEVSGEIAASVRSYGNYDKNVSNE
jgi:hypothetical protein